MSTEIFMKLKEYDSLRKMKLQHQKNIQDQNERLKILNTKKEFTLNAIEDSKKKNSILDQEYFDLEKKMNTCELQVKRIQDIGGDTEKILSFKTEAEKIENILLEHLSQIEEIKKTIKEDKFFLQGLEKTIQEISLEVEDELKKEHGSIDQLNLRLSLIEDCLPEDFRQTLLLTMKKNLSIGPFTRVENGSCFFCRYKISRLDESEIDMQQKLKICVQCSRIFLPYGS